MSSQAPAITELIARYALEADVASGPPDLTDRVLDALTDTVGVALAARTDAGVASLLDGTSEEFHPGPATILATGEGASAAYAALVNGMSSHALDYDDVADPMYGHPSVALFPPLLAAAQSEGVTGAELIAAYVVGFEVCGAISAALPIRRHYSRGWHSTATVGVIAATAALARLLRLSVTQAQQALGIAASAAGGSRQNFGTQTKPLHPGLAGWSAVVAARLARSGFTADARQLESPLGYFAMYGDGSDLTAVQRWLEHPWSLLEPGRGITVKKYPCCFNTHRTADATLSLAESLAGQAGSITSIRLTLEPGGFDPLIHHRPVTGLEGKFSAEYVVAAGLLDGRLGLATFSDAAVARPAAQALLRTVETAESAVPPFGSSSYEFAYAALEVEADGRVHRTRVDTPRGDSRNPLLRADVEAKFRDCVAYSGGPWDGEELLGDIRAIPAADRFAGLPHLTAAPLTDRHAPLAGQR